MRGHLFFHVDWKWQYGGEIPLGHFGVLCAPATFDEVVLYYVFHPDLHLPKAR